MKITKQLQAPIPILHLQGRLDALSAKTLEQTLSPLLATGTPVLLLSLTELDFVSSSGLRILLTTAKRINLQRGKLALSGLNANVYSVFEIAGFLQLFSTFDTVEQAVESLNSTS